MDSEQFWKLLEPWHHMAAAFSRKLAGDKQDGDDLYHDAVVAALENFPLLRNRAAFKPWLFRIIINAGRSRAKRGGLRRETAQESEIDLAGPDQRERLHLRHLLMLALEILAIEDRALVVLHEIQGWKVEELAEMFGKPAGTIKIRLFRAKQKMREWLVRRENAPETKMILAEIPYAVPRIKKADD